jgi:hypothetical protein
MDFAELQERVNAYVKLDLQPLFDAYQAQSGSSSIEGFIDFLRTARVIDASLLTELHAAGPVEIPKLDDPALAQTNLGAWAQRITATGTVIAPPPTGAELRAPAAHAAHAAHAAPAAYAAPAAPAAPAADIRYVPITLLGQGAMGAVHIARDVLLRRKVALKSGAIARRGRPRWRSRATSICGSRAAGCASPRRRAWTCSPRGS